MPSMNFGGGMSSVISQGKFMDQQMNLIDDAQTILFIDDQGQTHQMTRDEVLAGGYADKSWQELYSNGMLNKFDYRVLNPKGQIYYDQDSQLVGLYGNPEPNGGWIMGQGQATADMLNKLADEGTVILVSQNTFSEFPKTSKQSTKAGLIQNFYAGVVGTIAGVATGNPAVGAALAAWIKGSETYTETDGNWSATLTKALMSAGQAYAGASLINGMAGGFSGGEGAGAGGADASGAVTNAPVSGGVSGDMAAIGNEIAAGGGGIGATGPSAASIAELGWEQAAAQYAADNPTWVNPYEGGMSSEQITGSYGADVNMPDPSGTSTGMGGELNDIMNGNLSEIPDPSGSSQGMGLDEMPSVDNTEDWTQWLKKNWTKLSSATQKLIGNLFTQQGMGDVLSTITEGYFDYRGMDALREGLDQGRTDIQETTDRGLAYLDPYTNPNPMEDQYLQAVMGDIRKRTEAEFAKQGLKRSGAAAQSVADQTFTRGYLPWRGQNMGAAQSAASLAAASGGNLAKLAGMGAQATADWWKGTGQNISGTIQEASKPTALEQGKQALEIIKGIRDILS